MAVDTLGHLLALLVTPANAQERAQVAELAERVQEVTGQHVELALVDHGYTGEDAAAAAEERFLVLSGVVLLIATAGLAGGSLGRAGRLLTTVGAVGLVFAGVRVGAAGGELVYRHGAVNAYMESGTGTSGATIRPARAETEYRD